MARMSVDVGHAENADDRFADDALTAPTGPATSAALAVTRRRTARRTTAAGRHGGLVSTVVPGHHSLPTPPIADTTPPASITVAKGAQSEQELRDRLGHAIRTLRHRLGLTLVQLAERADLSHSFLSQLERGKARPSMQSLHRIAEALGTTQPALMSMAAGATDAAGTVGDVSLVRDGAGMQVDSPGGFARALVVGTRALYPLMFEGAPTEFTQAYTHPGDEIIFVVCGTIEVEIAGEELMLLGPGDTLCYPGTRPHRWRQVPGPTTPRVLMVRDSGCVAH
jgi:quercetin dioxygenase-like cupin family protein/ribosome-binding protein aMBF1 (putative translation factor)